MFRSRVLREGPDDCWPWTGTFMRNGYGQMPGGSRTMKWYAHRVAYRLARGPIPPGRVVDHECHNRDQECPGGRLCRHRVCCNPSHLALDGIGGNVLRGVGISAVNKAKTACVHGHPFTDENTYIEIRKGRRRRHCLACRRIRDANRSRRR